MSTPPGVEPLDLSRILRHRADYELLWDDPQSGTETRMTLAAVACAEDVPLLLAEVARLRALLGEAASDA